MDVNYQTELLTEITIGLAVIFIFAVGSYFQTKKIQICLKENDACKNLEITNSISVTLHWFWLIVTYGVTHVVKDLHAYTGEWFCFASSILFSIGDAHAMGHSFFIAFLKFLVIVHAETDANRKNKFKKYVFYFNLFYGVFVVGILNMVRPDYIFVFHSTMAQRCLGKSGVIASHDNTSSAVNLPQLCHISYPSEHINVEYALTVVRKFVCWFDVSFIYLNCANVLEAICYIRIFMYMNRYQITSKLILTLNFRLILSMVS